MKNILRLSLGELKRLVKYGILPVSLVTAVIWVIIFLTVSEEEALSLAPLFIFADATVMLIIFIGSSHHLEKQEGTVKSMLMMPVSIGEVLVSKIIAAMVLTIESAVITALALFFIHGAVVNYALLLLYVIIASCANAAIGFLLSLISYDFTSMLGLMMSYMLIFTIPTVLFLFEVIGEKYEAVLYFSPSHSVSVLISSVFAESTDITKVIISAVYLIIISAVILRLMVYPAFKRRAVRS